jgi:hypothetical protein
VPSHKTAHLRTDSPLYAGEIAGFEPRTAESQSGVTTNEPTLLPNEAPLLPIGREKTFCDHSHLPSCCNKTFQIGEACYSQEVEQLIPSHIVFFMVNIKIEGRTGCPWVVLFLVCKFLTSFLLLIPSPLAVL